MAVKRKEFQRFSRPVLKTKRWQLLRIQVLTRDLKCVDCGSTERLEVDHILPVRDRPGLAFDPSNLATRCARCHASKTRIECGWKPTDPARLKWRKAVAELGAETLASKGNGNA